MTQHMTAEPGHRYVYAVTDADRRLRQPEPTLSVQVRKAAHGDDHSASSAWDFTVGIDPIGGIWWDITTDRQPEYLPLMHTLGDWDTPTDTVAHLCAVMDGFGFTDVTDRG